MQKLLIKPIQRIDNKTIEEIKKLRTNVRLLAPDAKIFNIISTVGKEGKSLVAFWLSHTFAELGKRVIYIDANMRKNGINVFKIFKNKEELNNSIDEDSKKKKNNKAIALLQQENYLTEKTLKNFLMGKVHKEEIIFESNIDNMYFILSGHETERPSELLSEDSFSTLILYLRENFDYIIIDTPAAGEVTDGIIIAKHCDGCLMVLEPYVVPYALAQKVKEQVENTGTKVLGVVLNKV
jgi:capsular exopolysaccharide synthesis family protein